MFIALQIALDRNSLFWYTLWYKKKFGESNDKRENT